MPNIPASAFVQGTPDVRPCTVQGIRNMSEMNKQQPVENWVDDLMQVVAGPGSIAVTVAVGADEQHQCPLCKSVTSAKLRDVPNYAYYGLSYACECGATYSDEEICDVDEEPLAFLQEHLLAKHTPERIEANKADFAHWSARCAPAGTKAVYNDDATMLVALELPDGTTYRRFDEKTVAS